MERDVISNLQKITNINNSTIKTGTPANTALIRGDSLRELETFIPFPLFKL